MPTSENRISPHYPRLKRLTKADMPQQAKIKLNFGYASKYTAVFNPKPRDKRIKKAALQKSDLIFYLFLSAELDIDCPAEERSCPKPCTVLQAAKAKTADAIKKCIKIRIIPPSGALSAPCSRFHKRSGI